MPGLETLLSNLFVTLHEGDYFKALLEGLAKLIGIEQLNCKLYKLEVGWLRGDFISDNFGLLSDNFLKDDFFGCDDLNLHGDGLTDLAALGTTEAECELKDFVGGLGGVEDGDWDAQLEVLHSFNLVLNGNVHKFDGHTGLLNSLVQTKVDTLLPAPVGVVLDLEVMDDNLTRQSLEHVSGVRDDDSALKLVGSLAAFLAAAFPLLLAAFPLFLAVLPLFLVAAAFHFLLAVFPLLFGFFPVEFLGVDTHFVHETANHVFPPHGLVCDLLFGPFVGGFTVGSMTVGSTTVVSVTELALHLVPCFFHFLPVGLGGLLAFLVEDSNDG